MEKKTKENTLSGDEAAFASSLVSYGYRQALIEMQTYFGGSKRDISLAVIIARLKEMNDKFKLSYIDAETLSQLIEIEQSKQVTQKYVVVWEMLHEKFSVWTEEQYNGIVDFGNRPDRIREHDISDVAAVFFYQPKQIKQDGE